MRMNDPIGRGESLGIKVLDLIIVFLIFTVLPKWPIL